MDLHTSSPEETKKIAEKITKEAIKKHSDREGALVIALTGDLGAGKTNLTQGIAKFLGIQKTVTSPTFVIMKRYDISTENKQAVSLIGFNTLFHLDCYRIHSEEELSDMGWEDITADPKHLIIVEWAERIKEILPKNTVWVTIDSRGEEERSFSIKF